MSFVMQESTAATANNLESPRPAHHHQESTRKNGCRAQSGAGSGSGKTPGTAGEHDIAGAFRAIPRHLEVNK